MGREEKRGRMLVELFFLFKGQKMYVVICLFLRVSTLDHVEKGKGKGEREKRKGNEMKCCYMLPTGPRMSRL